MTTKERILRACDSVGYVPLKLEYVRPSKAWDGGVEGGWELDGIPIGLNVEEAIEHVQHEGMDLFATWTNSNGGAVHPNDPELQPKTGLEGWDY